MLHLLQETWNLMNLMSPWLGAISVGLGVYALILSNVSRSELQKLHDQIKESIQHFKSSIFDDVTLHIFEQLRLNTKLAFRLTSVDLEEKRMLGQILTASTSSGLDRVKVSFMHFLVEWVSQKSERSLFIESGSTLAYLTLELVKQPYIRGLKDPLRITTNNILVDFLMVYCKQASAYLLEGTPVGRYGATYGEHGATEEPDDSIKLYRHMTGLSRLDAKHESLSAYNPTDYYIGTIQQAQDMYNDICSFFAHNSPPEVIVMTTSWLSLVDGPHIGSFQNRDFKENLYRYAQDYQVPIIFVIYDAKIDDRPMNKNTCLSMFGADDSLYPAFDPGWSLDRKRKLTGFERFVRCVARGEITLIVTSAVPSLASLYSKEDNVGRLYSAMEQAADSGILEENGIVMSETGDRHARFFYADVSRLDHPRKRPRLTDFLAQLPDSLPVASSRLGSARGGDGKRPR